MQRYVLSAFSVLLTVAAISPMANSQEIEPLTLQEQRYEVLDRKSNDLQEVKPLTLQERRYEVLDRKSNDLQEDSIVEIKPPTTISEDDLISFVITS